MNDMAQHVDHLVSAYIEGQLSRSDMIGVRDHIARCDRCRETLARHERLSEDLRLVMKHFPPVKAGQIDGMWETIRQRRQPIRVRTFTPKLIPMTASLILILAMMVTPLFSRSTAAAASTSARLPEINTPFIPTDMTEPITAEIMATPQPEQQTPVTLTTVLSFQQPLQAVPPTAIDY